MDTPCPDGQRLATNERDGATIRYCVSMTDGRADGAYSCSFPDGAGITGSFTKNKQTGVWRYSHRGGELLRVERWEDGQLSDTKVLVDAPRPALRCGNHTIVADRDPLPNLSVGWESDEDGVARRHFPDTGTVWMEGPYRDGQKDGEWSYRRHDGTLRFRGRFVRGKPDGRWQEFDAAGGLRRSAVYEHGVKRLGPPLVREAASVRGAVSKDPTELTAREVRKALDEAKR
ncbi:MAG: hypothetical protein AAFX94_03630 [Myxococcota bacterium]